MTYNLPNPQGPQLTGPGARDILNNYQPAHLNRAGRGLSFAGGVLGGAAAVWTYNTISGRKSRSSFGLVLAASAVGTLVGIASSIVVFLLACLVQVGITYPHSGFYSYDGWLYLGSVLVSIVPAVMAGRKVLATARRNQADPAKRSDFMTDLARARAQAYNRWPR